MAHSRTPTPLERKLFNLIINEGVSTNHAAKRLGRSNTATGLRFWHMAVPEVRQLRNRVTRLAGKGMAR